MPLWILLIPFAIFLLVFLIFSLVDLINAWRFRSGFISAVFLIAIYLAGSAAILFVTYTILSPVDWMQHVGLGVSFSPTIAL